MWYYEVKGAHFGPVDTDRLSDLLRCGEIDDLTPVRREDDMVWRHLDETDLIWLLQDLSEDTPCDDEEEEDAFLEDEDTDFEEDEGEFIEDGVETTDKDIQTELGPEGKLIWYYEVNDGTDGPFSVQSIEKMLRRGTINELTLVRREGESAWHHLDETDLACLLTGMSRGRDSLEADEDEFLGTGVPGTLSPQEALAVSGKRLWYYMKDEMIFGPLTTAEIVAMRGVGEVYGQTLVSEGDTEHWQMLDDTDLANLRPNDQNQ